MNKKEKQERLMYQAQDDAYTMARYNEIIKDKARAARAVKVANKQAKDMQQQAQAMQAVAKTRIKKATPKKK